MRNLYVKNVWKLWWAISLLLVCVASETALAQNAASPAGKSAGDDAATFEPIYRKFYETYRLGPGDELAIRVAGQPDYTVDKAKVSPVGRVYHPLLGDVEVAGMTIEQVHKQFSEEFAEYLLEPKVSVELVEAQSAKIGVLGGVRTPGIIVMERPLTVLDAIMAAGGFTDTGSKSNISLLRQNGGRLSETKLNLKRVLDGKDPLAENLTLNAGDTVIVHGNFRKKLNDLNTITGLAFFVSFIAR